MICGRCHRCHAPIRLVLDGEEWCDRCGYQRPRSHGWGLVGDRSPCPDGQERTARYEAALREIVALRHAQVGDDALDYVRQVARQALVEPAGIRGEAHDRREASGSQ